MSADKYIPALRFHWLTRFYDPIVWLTTRESTFKPALIAEAELESASTILDVGCGTGGLSMMAKRSAPTARVVGLDADPQVLHLAASKVARESCEVDFVRADAAAMPFPDGEFDRIVSSLFFHHLRRDQKLAVLGECFRVMQGDGCLTFADWTKPSNIIAGTAFLAVRTLDGFAQTRDNADGYLPDLCRVSGFTHVEELRRFDVPLGTISIIRAAAHSRK